MTKRVISLLLILVMITGMLPVFAQAEESTTTIDNGELTVEGHNGVGDLLANDIVQTQEAMEEQSITGYTLAALEITGNTATVTYNSLEEATVVVAIYTENSTQMLASGKASVIPEETTATVTIESVMPEYFIATAYLLDSYDMSPLCPAYSTPMYTQEMQDLLNSTVDDYDSSRMLNMDESKDNNFAVYAPTTKIIEFVEGQNIVTTTDDQTNTYTITNANEQISSLQVGDIFAYAYERNNLLIVKVATIHVDGTTVTITGGELQAQEVFSHLKINGNGNSNNVAVDDSTASEGVSFGGTVTPVPKTRAIQSGDSETKELSFPINYKKNTSGDDLNTSISITGGLFFKATVGVHYYITLRYQQIQFKIDLSARAEITIVGKMDGKLKLGTIEYDIIPGVIDVGLEPKIVLKFHGELSLVATLTATLGVEYNSKSGIQNISQAPHLDHDIRGQVTIYLGFDLGPKVSLFEDYVAKLSIQAEAGVQVTGETTGSLSTDYQENAESYHDCKLCISMALDAKIYLSGKIVFFKNDDWTIPINIGTWTFPVGECYYSLDYNEFNSGTCPHVSYRITIYVTDLNRNGLPDISVTDKTGSILGSTNKYGVMVAYLPAEKHQLTAIINGKNVTNSIVVKCAGTIEISENSDGNTEGGIDSDFIDLGGITRSGIGGDNLTWTLYDSGILYFRGSGEMYNYSDTNRAPWYSYRSKIKSVFIQEGITHIGAYAFSYCEWLTSVTLPDSVISISSYAFNTCSKLTSVTIPHGVTAINRYTFYQCKSLTSVTIPDSVTIIGYRSFLSCNKLKSVTIPDSVTRIEADAFSCSGLTSVDIPASATFIGQEAFSACSHLAKITVAENNPSYSSDENGVLFNKDKTVLIRAPGAISGAYTIPNSVTTIEEEAFHSNGRLTSVTIPSSVTHIGADAFSHCYNLTSLTIENGVTDIGEEAFRLCTGITSLTIPDSVVNIGANAFRQCEGITSLTIGNGVTNIRQGSFYECYGIKSVTIGTNVVNIDNEAFYYCRNITSVTIPSSVCNIGNDAFNGCSKLKTVYYSGTQAQWDAITVGTRNTYITNATIYFNTDYNTMVTGNAMAIANGSLSGLVSNQMSSANAVLGGNYNTEIVDGASIKTASFSDLVPGEEYVLLSLVSLDVQELLSGNNLLYIDQGIADKNGALSFRYLQRVNTDISYVMVCGASNKNLSNATITFPEMTSNGELQIVQPTVVYDGKVLIQGQDYVITGDTDFSKSGEYTCYIRGIYQYTGLVTCNYTVQGAEIIQPTLKLKAPALEFKDMIKVIAFFTAENLDDVVDMGMITYTSKVDVVDISTAAHVIPGATLDQSTGRYFASSQGIHAKYLGDTVYLSCYAKLSDGSYVYTSLASYSPVQYATNQLKGTDMKLKQLCAAMLNYGAAAQNYFGYNTDVLANSTLTAEQIALPEAYTSDMVGTVPAAPKDKQGAFASNKGFGTRKPAVSFEGAFSINYFFTPSYTPVDGITLYYWTEADFNAADVLTVENASGAVAMTDEGSQFRGDIEGIAAKDLAKAIYVAAVYSDGTTTWTSGVLGYSIGAYCSSQATGTGTMAELAKATAVYGYHAKAYFG